MTVRKAVISGSFDPITIGHLDVIKRASAMFDEVYVAVCCNTEKGGGMFSAEERLTLASAAVSALDGVGNVKVEICRGLLVDYARERGIGFIVRGARTSSEFESESAMAAINRELGGVETVILPARAELSHYSSTYARDLIIYGKAELALSPATLEALRKIKSNK